ncbi:MAG: hypothetical protein QOF31_3950 [Mycobacterium sp.]|nr:hypothetical protein [Mycobacterium sp.]
MRPPKPRPNRANNGNTLIDWLRVKMPSRDAGNSVDQTRSVPTHSREALAEHIVLGDGIAEIDVERRATEQQHHLRALVTAHREHGCGAAGFVVERSAITQAKQIVDGVDRQIRAKM